MKACLTLFMLLLVGSIVYPQEIPAIQFSPHTRPVSPDYDCIAPTDFDAHVYTIGYDQYMVYLTWDMQTLYSDWIHWDDGEHFSGVGCCLHVTVAAKWDSGQLAGYHDYRITKMRVILNDTTCDSLIFKIWNGENETDLIYYDTIYDFYAGTWLEHELESEIYVNANEELWVGYSAREMPAGTFTFGVDKGEAIIGYGDLFRVDSDPTPEWDTLSEIAIDYNFNIQFFAEDTNENQKQVSRGIGERNIYFMGYNLYHSLNGAEYELLDFIPAEIDSNYYALPLDANPDLHCYKLTALWSYGNDTCESAPAKVLGNPSADSVCVLLVGEHVRLSDQQNGLSCYPNPFSNEVTIEYYLRYPQTITITFYDQFGKQVDVIEESQQKGLNQIIWSPENLNSGLYFYTFNAGEKTATGKLLLMK